MAKKEINDDLLSGAKLSTGEKIDQKKAKKKSGTGLNIPKRTAKIIKSVVAVVIVIALLAAYVCTGAVRKGLVASTGLPQKVFTAVTVTNGNQSAKIKVGTYNFYYATQYSSLKSQASQYEQAGYSLADLGLDVDFDEKLSKQEYTDPETNKKMTWEEHLNQLVLDAIESTYTYYLAAVEANGGKEPEISEENQNEIEETITNYTKSANQAGFTLSAYLTRVMGNGVTENVFRTEVTRQYIAQEYQSSLSKDNKEKGYTDKEIEKYKKEHLDDLKSMDIRIFECENEDDAVNFNKALNADGSNFAELAAKYSSKNKELNAVEEYTLKFGVTRAMMLQSGAAIAAADPHNHEEGEEHSDDEETTYSNLDWLFSSDRKAGDHKQVSTTVVYIITPAKLQDRKIVDVRHILIKPEVSEGASESTDKQWAAAQKKAEKLLADINKTDKSEDSFKGFVEKNSEDTGSAKDGGLISDITPQSSLVQSFLSWSLDNSRKAGDMGIVRTEYGFHIMYFVGPQEKLVWKNTVETSLANEDAKSQSEKLEDAYTISTSWIGSRYCNRDVDMLYY